MLKHAIYGNAYAAEYPICVLVPKIQKEPIKKEYLDAFGIDASEVLVLNTYCPPGKKKATAAEMKEYITAELVPAFSNSNVNYILCADAEYFKALTKEVKAEANLGYVKDCVYGPWKVIYVPNYHSVLYDPEKTRTKIAQAVLSMIAHAQGTYEHPGEGIIKFAAYPQTDEEIEDWLIKILQMDCEVAIDIEAFSLKHDTAGIGTICICWNEHEGIAFPVDYEPIEGATKAPYGVQGYNKYRRELLKAFFLQLTKTAMYHHISYDVYILIYQLFMDNILDTEGMLKGMDVMLKNWHDTKLITYLATNSCQGNELALKKQAQEFAGNWAQDNIEDIKKIPLPDLLQYNLIDGLSTWFTYKKRYPQMVSDQQLNFYNEIFKPAILDVVQMQLTGMPLNMNKVKKVKTILTAIEAQAIDVLTNSQIGKGFSYKLNEEWVEAKNAKLKKKRVTLADAKEVFNPRSNMQLQRLLFEDLGLPVLELTDTKQPSTGGDVIENLQNHTKDPAVLEFLKALIDYKAVDKLLTSFIPAFEAASLGPDGWWYLFGYFNLGGTVSGRLSSSDPNLQNLPANIYMKIVEALLKLFGDELAPFMDKGKLSLGKLIKWCFEAPPGWLFCGLDFNSLEDRISALTTKDPNKLRVYTDGFDGHCLRALSYFGERMPDIYEAKPTEVCYKANVGGTDVYFAADEDIEYLGRTMKGKELYELLTNRGL